MFFYLFFIKAKGFQIGVMSSSTIILDIRPKFDPREEWIIFLMNQQYLKIYLKSNSLSLLFMVLFMDFGIFSVNSLFSVHSLDKYSIAL